MIRLITIIILLILQFDLVYAAEVNTINLSSILISKNLSYANTDITLTGKICKDCEAIIDISGPKADYKIWKKEKKPPFWLKSREYVIKDAKSFYYLISTKDIKSIVSSEIAGQLMINNLCSKQNNTCRDNEFIDFYEKDLRKRNLLRIKEGQLEADLKGEFELQVSLPSGALNGMYVVRFFVFKGLELIATQQLKFKVKNNRFYSALNQFAIKKPRLYILFSISIALIFGYLAAFLFRRDK